MRGVCKRRGRGISEWEGKREGCVSGGYRELSEGERRVS